MIAKYFNQAFAALLLGACLLVAYVGGNVLTWSDVWTIFLAIVFFLVTFSNEDKSKKASLGEKLSHLQIVTITLCTVGILLWRYLATSLWLDELSQFQNVDLLQHGLSLVKSAADQQQPPLDLYFQHLSQWLLPAGEFTLRFFPMFFFVGSILNLNILLRSVTGSGALVFLGLTLFIFNPLISYFSAEARPYSLAIFLAIIFIQHLIHYQRNARPLLLLQLAVSGSLFTTTIGLQPVLIVLAGTATLFFCSTSRQEKRQIALWGALFCLGVLVTYWPILMNSFDIKKIGLVSMRSWSDFNFWIQIILSYFSLQTINTYSIILAGLATLALVISIFRFKVIEKPFFEIVNILTIFLLTAVCFIFFINWPYYEKFSVVSFVYMPLFVVRMLDSVLQKLKQRKDSYESLQAALAWIPLIFILNHFIIHESVHQSRKEDWRAFKIEMQNYKNAEVKAFSLLDYHLPPIHTLFGSKVYLNKNNYDVKDNMIVEGYFRSVTDLHTSSGKNPLVLAMPHTWSQDDVDSNVANSMGLGKMKGVKSFRFWASSNADEIGPFMSGLAWIYAGQSWSFSLLESLLMFYSKENNTNMTLRIEKELWSLVKERQANEILGVKSLGEKQEEFFNNYFDELKSHVR